MDDPDISYLLGRCRSHRALAHITTCAEARSIHQQFVSSYQRRLLALRTHARVGNSDVSGAADRMMLAPR